MSQIQSLVVANIKKRMAEQGLTQAQLNKGLGVSLALVVKWFSNKSPLALDRLESIAELLGVQTLDLINGTWDKNTAPAPAYPPGSLPALAAKVQQNSETMARLLKESQQASEQIRKLVGV